MIPMKRGRDFEPAFDGQISDDIERWLCRFCGKLYNSRDLGNAYKHVMQHFEKNSLVDGRRNVTGQTVDMRTLALDSALILVTERKEERARLMLYRTQLMIHSNLPFSFFEPSLPGNIHGNLALSNNGEHRLVGDL
jgi:hypothetical protein